MSERNSPDPQSNPHWLMAEADLLRFGRQGGESGSAHRLPWPRGRANMPAPSGSGYEQILAARGELRTRADRAIADPRRPSAKPTAPTAPAAARSLEPPSAPPRRFERRDRPALVLWGLLIGPAACVLVALAGAGPSWSPGLPATAPESGRAALRVAGAGPVVPPPSANGGEPAIATRASWPRTSPDDAEPVAPLGGAWLGPAPTDAEAEPAFALPASGFERQTAQADLGPEQESDSPDAAPSGPDMLLEEVEAAFATWDRSTPAWPLDGGSEASITGSEPGSAARDRDAAVAETAPHSDTTEDGRAPSAATDAALDAEAVRDDPPQGGAAAAVAPDHAPPTVPSAPDAMETAVREDARDASPPTGPGEHDSASGSGPTFPLEERHHPSATRAARSGQMPEAALPSTGTDAAPGAEASGGSPAAAPTPPRMAGLAETPATLPAPAKLPPIKPRLGGTPVSAPPSSDARCRAIVVKAQLGEETSHAERLLLRSGCGARR